MTFFLTAFLPAALYAAGPALNDLVDPIPGQLGAYEGKSAISQTLGASPPSEVDLATSFSYMVLPGGKDGEKRFLLVRAVTPQANGLPMPPYSDAGFFWVSKTLEVTPVDDSDPSPHLKVLELQLPSAIFPSYEIPEGGEASREDAVRVFGRSTAKLPVKISVARAGGAVTVTRILEPGKTATLDLDGSPSIVEAWTEVHVFDTARRIFTEMRRELKVSGQRGEFKMQLRLMNEVKLKDVRMLTEPEIKQSALLDKEVGGILDDFRGKKHPRDIYQRIHSLTIDPQAKLLAGLGDALLSKLSYYRQGRDHELAAGASTGVMGNEAPDFTLEDLAGKRVSFREATKGKVVLLAFWGFG